MFQWTERGVHGQTGPLVLSRAVVDNSREHVAATTRHRGTEAPIVAEITRNHDIVTAISVQVRTFQSRNVYQSSENGCSCNSIHTIVDLFHTRNIFDQPEINTLFFSHSLQHKQAKHYKTMPPPPQSPATPQESIAKEAALVN